VGGGGGVGGGGRGGAKPGAGPRALGGPLGGGGGFVFLFFWGGPELGFTLGRAAPLLLGVIPPKNTPSCRGGFLRGIKKNPPLTPCGVGGVFVGDEKKLGAFVFGGILG